MSNKPSMSKYLGFVDGKTYVNIDTGNWEEKLRWLLENPDKVRQIARSGMKNTLMNHSHQTRAEQFLEILNG
jgi:spore maturation protein CgeB